MQANLSLYLIADPDIPTHRSFFETVEEAIKGGVTIVQLRAKKRPLEEFLKLARTMRYLTLQYRIPFIVNDNVEIAQAVDSDGVHLGQSDTSIEQAREILGFNKIVGLSAHTPEEARDAEERSADYVGVGSVYSTTSKEDISGIIGATGLVEVRKSVKLPMVAIGGIDASNVSDVIETGVDGVAVISSIMKSDRPREEARIIRDIINRKRITK